MCFEFLSTPQTSVETSLDTARMSARATLLQQILWKPAASEKHR